MGELLARRLGYLLFDTGVMYRAVTWAALSRGVCTGDEAAVTALAEEVHIDVLPPTVADGRKCTVLLDGVDISWEIRRPEVDAQVSVVSAYAGVRQAMVRQQRRVAEGRPVVMLGRDIGTVVLPDAELKVYLDASVEERARRRTIELEGRGQPADYAAVLASMRQRDEIDSHRAISPLRAAPDAVRLDTTGMSAEAVVDELLARIEERDCRPA